MKKTMLPMNVLHGENVLEQKEVWKMKGEYWLQERLKRDISRNEMARNIGTTASRLARFEKGEPVKQALSIESSYHMLFELMDLKQENRLLIKHWLTANFEANKKNKIIFI